MLNHVKQNFKFGKGFRTAFISLVFYLAGCKMFIVKNGSVEVLSFLKLCPNLPLAALQWYIPACGFTRKFTNKGISHL